MRHLLTYCLFMCLWLVSFASRAQGDVNVYITELDASGNPVYNVVHCPGDQVTYSVWADHYDNFKTRIYVSNGTVAMSPTNSSYASFTSISSTELLIEYPNGVNLPEARFTATWSNATTAQIHAVAYYHYYGFLFTQQSDGYKDIAFYNTAQPNPIQSSYPTCGNSPVSIAVEPVDNTPSYNWYSPNAGWNINNSGQFVSTTSSGVTVTPPAGVATGTYQIQVSSTSPCGTTSTATINILVDNAPAVTPYAFFAPDNNYTRCNPTYDVISHPVYAAVGYQATLSNGLVRSGIIDPATGYVSFNFHIAGPQNGISASVVAFGVCGNSSPYVIPAQSLDGPANGCGPIEEPPYYDGRVAAQGSENSIEMYPNPATDQVVVQGIGQEAQIAFYDSKNGARKNVTMHKQDAETAISLVDLPAGIYTVRVLVKGKAVLSKQLVVRH